jgi:hypothetical protein
MVPKIIVFKGREFPITSPVDFHIEAQFTRWLEQEAYLVIERHSDLLNLVEVARQKDSWRRDCGLHIYDWGSEYWLKGYSSRSGVKELAWLQLKRAENPANLNPLRGDRPLDREQVEEMFKDEKIRSLITDIIWEQDRPNVSSGGPSVEPQSLPSSPS